MVEIKSYQEAFERYGRALGRVLRTERGKIQIMESSFNENDQQPLQDSIFGGLDDSLKVFYTHVHNWKVKWQTVPILDFRLEGSINILPLKDIIDFDESTFLPEEDLAMRGFRLLDYFYNEGAVGLYINEPERGLYMFLFDGETEALHLDFKGYLDLLMYTKGVSYWQNLIVTHLTKVVQPNVLKIREHLPKLFPDFSYEEFIERYESVRIPSFS